MAFDPETSLEGIFASLVCAAEEILIDVFRATVHKATNPAVRRLMELILRDLALRAGASDPVALAEQLSVIMEGAYVTRQVTRNARTTDIARKLGDALFGKYLILRKGKKTYHAVRLVEKISPDA